MGIPMKPGDIRQGKPPAVLVWVPCQHWERKNDIRNNKIVIDGYVNAVERESKVLYDTRGEFIEKIRAGVFQKALERADNVRVLLDHEQDRELADTKSGKAKLYEDNIGLRAIVEIEDSEVIEKARNNKVSISFCLSALCSVNVLRFIYILSFTFLNLSSYSE